MTKKIPNVERYSNEFRKKAILLSDEKKLRVASDELGIPIGTLASWRKKPDREKIFNGSGYKKYTMLGDTAKVIQDEAVELAAEVGIAEAARIHGLKYQTLWSRIRTIKGHAFEKVGGKKVKAIKTSKAVPQYPSMDSPIQIQISLDGEQLKEIIKQQLRQIINQIGE